MGNFTIFEQNEATSSTFTNEYFIFLQLYTAFYIWNVQRQLRDTDVIFSMLKSLGYTITEQDQVSVRDPDFDRALWVSMELFLVQVDLEMMKEIMDNFPNSKFTLKKIVKVRARTCRVDDACKYLSGKIAKRQKLDGAQGAHAASDNQGKETHGEGINAMYSSWRSNSAVAIVEPSTSKASKNFPSPNATDTTAMDVDDSSTVSVGMRKDLSGGISTSFKGDVVGMHLLSNIGLGVSDRDLYGVGPAENHPHGSSQHRLDANYDTLKQTRPSISDFAKGVADQAVGSSCNSPPYPAPMATPHSSHRYSTQGCGNYAGGDLRGINVISHSDAVRPAPRAMAGTDVIQSKITVRAVTQVQGSSGSNKSDRDTETRPNGTGAEHRQSQVSALKPMEVNQTGRNSQMQNNFAALSNGMAEGTCTRRTSQTGVTDLNTSLEHQLTLASTSAGSMDKTSQNLRGESMEQRRPYDSQRQVATGSQDRSTRETRMSDRESKPSRASFRFDSNMSGTESAQKARANAVDFKGYTTEERIEAKGTSPVPSGRNPDYNPSLMHRDLSSSPRQTVEVQYEAHSSRNDLHTGHGSNGSVPSQARAGKPLSKDRAAICDMCTSNGTHICRNCCRFVCKTCKEIYETDLCSATKGQHKFKELKKKPQQQRSADVEGLSSQGGANVNEGMEDEGEEWSCSRCTYLNPADYRICTMCAASRGFSSEEQSEPGSRVCNNCTWHNKQGTKVCAACHKTIDLSGPPTSFV